MKLIAAICVAVACAAAPAYSATLDFSASLGLQGTELVLPNATITARPGTEIVVGPANTLTGVDGFCVFTYATLSCGGDGDITFSSAVSNLSFDADGALFGDTVDILAYLGDTLLGSVTITSPGRLDFSTFGSITRLAFIDLDSTRSGFGYSTFEFEFADMSTVPLPASGWLLVASLGGITAMRRISRL